VRRVYLEPTGRVPAVAGRVPGREREGQAGDANGSGAASNQTGVDGLHDGERLQASGRVPESFEAVQHQVQRELELELVIATLADDANQSAVLLVAISQGGSRRSART
jgi:hypothetical protein